MRLVYSPEGVEEPMSWDFVPSKILSPEAELIERHTGWTFQEFGVHFLKGSTLARHALLYVMLKRATPGLRFDDVQFAMDEVDVVYSNDELRSLRDALEDKARTAGLEPEEETVLDELRKAVDEGEPAPFTQPAPVEAETAPGDSTPPS